MWSRSHAPWEAAAARPIDDKNDLLEQVESRRIEGILKQNGVLGARLSSIRNKNLRFEGSHNRSILNWSPPKRRKTVVEVVSSTDFGYAGDLEHERQTQRSGDLGCDIAEGDIRRTLLSEQTMTKSMQKPVLSHKDENYKPRRIVGEKFWELDEYDCRICLDRISRTFVSLVTPCMHKFCFKCIRKWTKSKATCAICNTTVDSICYAIISASDFKEILLHRDSGRKESDTSRESSAEKPRANPCPQGLG